MDRNSIWNDWVEENYGFISIEQFREELITIGKDSDEINDYFCEMIEEFKKYLHSKIDNLDVDDLIKYW